jgi:uncharacterized Zn-binding protein involved in type VI secretion
LASHDCRHFLSDAVSQIVPVPISSLALTKTNRRESSAIMPPAARISDMHVCPMATPGTPPIPHVGGPVMTGLPTVLIGGVPAARVTDTAICVGPPDAVAKGSLTVMIGNLPAARIGDPTMHGGVVMTGCPTVIIGDVGAGGAGAPAAPPFTDEYLKKLIGKHETGAGTLELHEAMNTLWEHRHDPDDPAVEKALERVAKARNQPIDKMKKDWLVYQAALAEQEKNAAKKGENAASKINTALHEKFMGSASQLRSGRIVGDALGMDPVFGALLNPTGGLVGPDNKGFDGDDSALGYHGAVHDAGGYLYNYHDKGPGYDYLGLEKRNTGNPLSGQREGIRYWRDRVPDRSITTRAKDAVGEGVMRGFVPLCDVYGSAKDVASDVWDWLTK